MRDLGTLNGTGLVSFDGKSVSVAYAITVMEGSGNVRRAQGHLMGEAAALFEMMGHGEVELALETGEKVSVIIVSYNPGGDAEIFVSGPVPGFEQAPPR